MMGNGCCQGFSSAQAHSKSLWVGGVLSPPLLPHPQHGYGSPAVRLTHMPCPYKPKNSWRKPKGAVLLLDLVDIPACLSNTLGAATSTTCWAQGSGDVPRGGGQPEEIFLLLFKQPLLKSVVAGHISFCPHGFAVHRAGSKHSAGAVSTALCVAPPLQNTPCTVCIQINAQICS